MSKVSFLVLHSTATLKGRHVSSEEIKRWHLTPQPEGRGWKQVGYEGMFHLDGKWEQLVDNNNDDIVDTWEITNGASGYNGKARHWVYVGGLDALALPEDTRTEEQKTAMAAKVIEFHKKFPEVKIIGHNEISKKHCPCFDVQAWLKSIGICQHL